MNTLDFNSQVLVAKAMRHAAQNAVVLKDDNAGILLGIATSNIENMSFVSWHTTSKYLPIVSSDITFTEGDQNKIAKMLEIAVFADSKKPTEQEFMEAVKRNCSPFVADPWGYSIPFPRPSAGLLRAHEECGLIIKAYYIAYPEQAKKISEEVRQAYDVEQAVFQAKWKADTEMRRSQKKTKSWFMTLCDKIMDKVDDF